MTTTAEVQHRCHTTLRMIAQGCTDKQIANHLGVQRSTIRNYVTRIYRQLGARDRAHAVHLAWQQGLLGPDRGEPRS